MTRHLLRGIESNIDDGYRPYLYVHLVPTSRENQVINLIKATIMPSPDVEILLGVSVDRLGLYMWLWLIKGYYSDDMRLRYLPRQTRTFSKLVQLENWPSGSK